MTVRLRENDGGKEGALVTYLVMDIPATELAKIKEQS